MKNKNNNCVKLKVQNIEFVPFISFDDETVADNYNISRNESNIQYTSENFFYKDDIYIKKVESGYVFTRVFQNISKDTLLLRELGIKIDGIDFGLQPADDYFYHNENPRIYETMTFPIDYNRTAEDAKNSEFDVQANNRWADPGVVHERIGRSPYQPFPAVLISNYKSEYGIVHGTLSQDVFYHNYIIDHSDKGIRLNAYSSFKGLLYRELRPDEILTDEFYIGETFDADNIELIFKGYTKELRKRLVTNYGSTDINRHSLVWGSWNGGFLRNISEDILLDEARAIKEDFPMTDWIQIDDGYAVYDKSAHGLGVPYEGEKGIDHKKFPHGLRHTSDKLKAMGFRPAIWIGGLCPVKTKIYKEHPEWFSDYSKRLNTAQPLDVSKQEVRDYMLYALDTLINQYGFEGVKHDFWSYAFEESDNILSENAHSGYEYRTWWAKELRKRLPDDGYLQTGCDLVMANPFLGKYFTNYRYGVDVTTGNWDQTKSIFLWGAGCFATHTGDLFVPNSDGISTLIALPDKEAFFFINYVTVTRSMVELAGDFSNMDRDSCRFKAVKKVTCNINNGEDVYFSDYDYRLSGFNAPDVIYIKTPFFASESAEFIPQRTVGVFNLYEENKIKTISVSGLDLPEGQYILTDVWTGEQIELNDKVSISLTPHESRMFLVNRCDDVQIYDSDIKMSEFVKGNNFLSFSTSYGKIANITISNTPKKVLFDQKEIEFTYNDKNLILNVPGAGKVSILF